MQAVISLRCQRGTILFNNVLNKNSLFSFQLSKLSSLNTRPYLQKNVQISSPTSIFLKSHFILQRNPSSLYVPYYPIREVGTGPNLQKDAEDAQKSEEPEKPEKLSLFKRYKKMLKEYWYVLMPVHIVTSTVWFGLFYYIAKSGFDIVPFLEMVSIPESIIKPLRNSSLGYIAVASALYKLATPARYMVTLGGTTVAIKQLTKRGLIKPAPSKDKVKSFIKSKFPSKKSSSTKDET